MKSFFLYVLWLVLRLYAVFRPVLIIAPEGKPYLIRWYLTPRGKWWSDRFPRYFLHVFLSSDPARGFHSHPWIRARSLILRGRYREYRAYGPRTCDAVFRPGMYNIIKATDFHRVKLLDKRVWTLFEAGPLHGNEWQFMDEIGKTRPHGTGTPGD